ncbi:MAG: inorganic pyrophosphatase [bacterium]|nr:inorganic pyrophosphatase [bacterium]
MQNINQFKAHPWHGVSPGDNLPKEVTAYIEVVPSDTVKYEIDKKSGFLIIDRPQKFSNVAPALYGFIPQTYCGTLIAEFASQQTGRTIAKGDGDPLDICVLCEPNIPNGDFLLHAIPIGGIRMIDKGEADDKIIAVLKSDEVYANWLDVTDVPDVLINRLKHYFLTYKTIPGAELPTVEIAGVYGREEAYEVIRKSRLDYQQKFGENNTI